MEGLVDLFWEWAPELVLMAVAFALVKWLVLSSAGNERQKEKGWSSLGNVGKIVAVGVIVSLAFPQVREKLGAVMDDPCQIIGFACRR